MTSTLLVVVVFLILFLLVAGLAMAWENHLHLSEIHSENMANISTLAPSLIAIQAKVNRIFLEVQALKDAFDNAGEIPADAVALLSNLEGNLNALEAVLPDLPPAPSPLP